jgi:hypothetical protein
MPKEAKEARAKTLGTQELFVGKPTAAVNRTRSDRYATIYTNNVQVGISLYDVRLFLNDVVSASKGRIDVEEQAVVVMSPEQARDVSEALNRALAQYEERFGPIRPSPEEAPKA